MRRACATHILIGPHIWSCQNDFSWILFIFFSPSQYDTKNNSEYIKWPFSIGYFERYVNLKSDYLELLSSVYRQQSNNLFDRTCNHKNLTLFFCHKDDDYNLKYKISLVHIYRYKCNLHIYILTKPHSHIGIKGNELS